MFWEERVSTRGFSVRFRNVGVLNETAALGSFQMNHVWMARMKSLSAKHRLLAAKELQVKGKRCLFLDPNKAELRIRIHWVPYDVANDCIRSALEGYETVEEVSRETWRVDGFQGIETTTRRRCLISYNSSVAQRSSWYLGERQCACGVSAPDICGETAAFLGAMSADGSVT